MLPHSEILYGGAAGGGKSVALLAAALQYVDMPGYNALIIRRNYQMLAKPGALLDLSKQWLMGTDAKWNETAKKWTFPSGATLTFGHMDDENSKYNYQGSEYAFVAYDELTQFTESMYQYLKTRRRQKVDHRIPSRTFAASNPGGVGHEWVKKYFIQARHPDRIFVPATLADNPSLDREDYIRAFEGLDPILVGQMLRGDWDAFEGGRFKRGWFHRFRRGPHYTGREAYFPQPGEPKGWQVEHCWRFTICDPACTPEDTTRGLPIGTSDPDYTTIGTYAVTPQRELLVLDMVRERLSIDRIVPRICEVNERWQPAWIGIEAVGAFIALVLEAQKRPGLPPVNPLSPGISQYPNRSRKLERATPAIIMASSGRIFVPDEPTLWLDDFMGELVQFTGDPKLDAHDDVVDNLSYAVQEFSRTSATQFDPNALPDRGEAEYLDLAERERRGEYESAAERRGLFGFGH
jgi:predicted phage terminase large subunit-like protein